MSVQVSGKHAAILVGIQAFELCPVAMTVTATGATESVAGTAVAAVADVSNIAAAIIHFFILTSLIL